MINVILVIIILALVGFAAGYMYRAKKQGQACIGCPYSKTCKSHNCGCEKIHKNTCIFCQSGIYYIKINKKRELVVQAERKV